jgi:hypothetical protein
MIANRTTMSDKTLKIRIKLQPAETSTVSLDTPSKVYPKEVGKLTHTKGDRRWRRGALFILSGVVGLLVAGYLIFYEDKNETPQVKHPVVDSDVSTAHESIHSEVETQGTTTPSEPSIVAMQDTLDSDYVNSKLLSHQQPETAENVHQSISNEKELPEYPYELQNIPTVAAPGTPGSPKEIKESSSTHNKAESLTSFDNKKSSNLLAVDSDSSFTRNQSEAKENKFSSSYIDSNSVSSMAPLPSSIARAQFTNGIKNREPIDHIGDRVQSTEQTSKRLFYFTELRDMKGEKITHRWKYNDNTMAKVNFNVGGARWRVYSSKNLTPSMKGEWQIIVTDSANRVILTDSIIYD